MKYLTYKTTTLHEKIVHGMLFTLCVAALLYVLVLISLIFSVIERKQHIVSTRDLSSKLSSLEASYANVVSSISDTDLHSNGFVRVDNTTFAVRKDDIASYTVLYAR